MVLYMRLDNCGLNQPVRYADPQLPSRRCVCACVCVYGVHVCKWTVLRLALCWWVLLHCPIIRRDASVLFSIYGIMKVPAQQFDLNVQFYISVRLGY